MRGAILAIVLAVMSVGICWGQTGEDQDGPRVSAGCDAAPPAAPGKTTVLFMEFGGLEREARVHLPRGYDASRPTSLVLDFHGYTGSAETEERETTGFSRHSDQHGYIVVYPQSTAFVSETGERITSWNDLAGNASPGPEGPICSETAFQYAFPPECGEPRPCVWATCHDDLGFVAELLDRLEAALCVDLDRVYATGMSNGAMFVHRLGCAMPERFAAIAPVGGTLALGFNCAPDRSSPLSIMNIYGSRDDYVSQEMPESSDGYRYTAASEVMKKWADATSQDCGANPTRYPTSVDGTLDLACMQHPNCASSAEVVHCIWDGGHDWPKDGDNDFGNDVIWEFFSRHSRAQYSLADEGE